MRANSCERGRPRSVELTRACLARIERPNPVLNAFITVTGDQALAKAKAAEMEIAKGRRRGRLYRVRSLRTSSIQSDSN
jgi:Asp-tRNA(Asn)/Glu-tRNA(Gln) amidotransferase A subunit family amidase